MSEWLTIDEILSRELDGYPKERSALSRKAAREGWDRRKRETPGKRGITYEYLIPTIPSTTPKDTNKLDTLSALLEALTEDELQLLINTVKRKGAEALLYIANECNYAILQLPAPIKAKIIETYIKLPPTPEGSQLPQGKDEKIYSSGAEETEAGSSLASNNKRAG